MTAAAAWSALLPLTAASPETRALPTFSTLRVMASSPASARTLPAALIVRLSNGELRQRTRHHRLAIWARQCGANQRTTHGSFLANSGDMDRRVRHGLVRVALSCRVSVGPWRRIKRGRLGMVTVAGLMRQFGRKCSLLLVDKCVIRIGLGQVRKAGDGLWRLQAVEHLRKQRGLRSFPPLRWQFSLFVLVFCVTDNAAGLFDPIVDHGDDGVIRDTALARTVVVQHVAGPIPALLHALPRKTTSDHDAGREIGH